MSLTAVLIIAAVILFGVIGAVVQVWPSSPFVGVGMDDWDAQRVDHFCYFRCHLDSGNNPEIHHPRQRND